MEQLAAHFWRFFARVQNQTWPVPSYWWLERTLRHNAPEDLSERVLDKLVRFSLDWRAFLDDQNEFVRRLLEVELSERSCLLLSKHASQLFEFPDSYDTLVLLLSQRNLSPNALSRLLSPWRRHTGGGSRMPMLTREATALLVVLDDVWIGDRQKIAAAWDKLADLTPAQQEVLAALLTGERFWVHAPEEGDRRLAELYQAACLV